MNKRQIATSTASAAAGLLLSGVLLSLTGTTASGAPLLTFQGEHMALPSYAGQVRSDSSASGNRSLIVWSNGAATRDVALTSPATLVLRARGDLCSGGPRVQVKVGSTVVLDRTLSSATWASYTATVTSPRTSGARVSVAFLNDYRSSRCDRNLHIDTVSFLSAAAPTPTPTPTTTTAAPSPTPTTSTQPAGQVLFDSAVGTKGLTAYASTHNAHRVSIVNDPVNGAARKVMKFTVYDSDDQLTGNPRAQLETAKQFGNGDDIYIGWSMLFPSDYPTTLPSGGWLTFAEVYGPPYAGGSPIRIGAQNGSTAPAAVLGNGTTVPWRLPSLQRNKWYDFVLHEKLSTSASTGYVELWVNSGDGWVKQRLGAGERLPLATLGTANSGGANYHKLAVYRQKGMFNAVTTYFADHRIGTTFAAAAPRRP